MQANQTDITLTESPLVDLVNTPYEQQQQQQQLNISSNSNSNGNNTEKQEIKDPVFDNLPKSRLRPFGEHVENSVYQQQKKRVNFAELQSKAKAINLPNPMDPEFATRMLQARQNYQRFKQQQQEQENNNNKGSIFSWLLIFGTVAIGMYFSYKYIFPIATTASANTDIKLENNNNTQ